MPMPWVAEKQPLNSEETKYERIPNEEEQELEGEDDSELEDTALDALAGGRLSVVNAAKDRLRDEVERYDAEEKAVQRQLDFLNEFWGTKAVKLKKVIEACTSKRKMSQDVLTNLENPQDKCLPPGMRSLMWVIHPKFTALCSVVVVMNLITMFMEMVNPSVAEDYWLLDQVVLVFYITELTLKALLFQRELLLGPCGIVWWNWLDLIIVLVGIVDQWLQPLYSALHPDAAGGNHSQAVQIIKMLRIARLARILKTVRAFMQSDLAWTEGKNFQLFIMGTIAANSIIMSFESDFPDFWGWFYVEQALLIIFSFELLVRLRFQGCRFFYHPSDIAWNWLDFTIVLGGIIDEWMMPAISLIQTLMGMKKAPMFEVGEIMTTLRMARLLRILRLVRLVKNVPPLFTLIVGILQAMQGMAWVLVLTAVFLYAFALLSVRLIGHGLLFGGMAPPEVAAIFPSVPQSMFVLFKVMNGDDTIIEPLFQALPMSKLVFVLYMVVSSWAILSILTAVVAENMINATDAHRAELEGDSSFQEERVTREWLRDTFASAVKVDTDDLGWEDFQTLLDDEATLRQLEDVTLLKRGDLEQVYIFLRTTDKVSREDFIDALRTEKRSVTERSVLRLEKRLINLQNAFDMQLGQVTASARQPEVMNAPLDNRSIEILLQSLFANFEDKLERRGRDSMEVLAARLSQGIAASGMDQGKLGKNLQSVAVNIDQGEGANLNPYLGLGTVGSLGYSKPSYSVDKMKDASSIASQGTAATASQGMSGSFDYAADRTQLSLGPQDVSSIASALARIEEQGDLNAQLLDRSRAECTIVQGLSKIEKQNIDIRRALYDRGSAESSIKSSLAKIEERLESGAALFEMSSELASLESVMLRIDRQLQSITGNTEGQATTVVGVPMGDNLLTQAAGRGQNVRTNAAARGASSERSVVVGVQRELSEDQVRLSAGELVGF